MANGGGPSQRVHERLPATLVVTFRLPGRAAFIERYAANVSRGGIFIVSREVHPIGSEIRFEIRSVDGSMVFSGRGIVRWTKLHDPVTKQLPGLGVQFTQLDDENQAVLEKLLALQANTLTEPSEIASTLPAAPLTTSTPLEVSETLQAGGADLGWPAQVPSLTQAVQMLVGQRPTPEPFQAASEAFVAQLSPAERAGLGAGWPAEVANRFRTVLATQWRLAVATGTRPAHVTPNTAALDQLFAEAEDALAALTDLEQSVVPEVKTACATARTAVAHAVQELLSTSDAAPVAAARPATPTLRPKPASERHAPPAPTKLATAPTTGWRARFGTKAATGLAVASLAVFAWVVWSNLAPLRTKPLPELPPLPAGLVVLGNPESGQVILQRKDAKPLPPDLVEELTASAKARGIRVTALGNAQLLLEP